MFQEMMSPKASVPTVNCVIDEFEGVSERVAIDDEAWERWNPWIAREREPGEDEE